MYNSKSKKAEEFISDEEILKTLETAKEQSQNKEYVKEILNKARACNGIDYTEATTLLLCDDEEVIKEIYEIAHNIKQKIYGNRIVMFAPLYLSNYCVNGCLYCSYHHNNTCIKRKKLTQEEIAKEVTALQDMGHKRLALEAGEDPENCPIEYILESIKTVYSTKHKNGSIRRVNINIAATTVENYRKLKEAEIGTYILFQETYHKPTYERLHPTGPKHNYAYHTEAMDRAMEGGIDNVGIGALFGLYNYQYDFVGLLLHAKHLEDTFGVGPHTISVPRICPAENVDLSIFHDTIPDDTFKKIVAILRIAVPYTGIIVSTRESKATRREVLKLGVSQISGGSITGVGGYAKNRDEDEGTAQFDVTDTRPLDEVVRWLCEEGYVPSFCTACYRQGRTGDRFMSFAKSGEICNYCQPNALLTLKEYQLDYANDETKRAIQNVWDKEIERVARPEVKEKTLEMTKEIEKGNRDFRF